MHKYLLFLVAFGLISCGVREPVPDPRPHEQAPLQANDANKAFAKKQAEQQKATGGGATDDQLFISDRMAGEHEGDTPEASEAAKKAPTGKVVTKEVAYFKRADEPINGYLAYPEGETKNLPAVLVIHEWWGLNDNVRAMTRRLAGEGYMALAVDLYNGEVAQTPEDARRQAAKVMQNESDARTNISAARQFLEREHSPKTMGLIGWCFGGGWALRGALNMRDDVDAVVMYYGETISDESQLANLKAPLLGIFGAKDEAIPPKEVQEFEAALKELGKDATIRTFDADHAFANPSGQNYDEEAAEKAWAKTLGFLEKHLK